MKAILLPVYVTMQNIVEMTRFFLRASIYYYIECYVSGDTID